MTSPQAIAAIEAALGAWCPGRFRRLTAEEMRPEPLPSFRVGWRIDLVAGAVRSSKADYLFLVVDAAFPNSQPRVIAPGMGSDYQWPHVEQQGVLCLRSTSIAAVIGDRIQVHLDDALELLNYTDEKCASEFEREFGAYWSQRARQRNTDASVVSLLKPGGRSREVPFFVDQRLSRLVVADTEDEAKAWLRNSGINVSGHDLSLGQLVRLKKPWRPCEFPETLGDAIRGLPDDVVHASLLPNRKSLFLFEAKTSTGPVFAAVLTSGVISNKIQNGFRTWARVPVEHIKRAVAQQRIDRIVVSRVDSSWIHGRGHSSDQPGLSARRVAIVGCGSVGSGIAELLAKAGVGELTLIDHDELQTANVSRHLLGINYLGWNKAKGVAAHLQRHLPNLKIGALYRKKFERLTPVELGSLAGMDMIVTAGLEIEGEAAVNDWRLTLKRPPAYLSTWVEAYAIVGHTVLLYGMANLFSRFEGEQPAFRLTDWPDHANALIVEAGCGNVFQPHGAVDLQPTIAMAAKLALDALLGRVPDSCRRVWFGDRDAVAALGGTPRADFTEVNAWRQLPW